MRIRLLCVGKPRDPASTLIHDRYAERLGSLGIHYETAWVAEVRPDRKFSDEHVREREARSLLQRLDGKDAVIALDRHGELLQSEQLAERFERRTNQRWTLVVGGPLGLHRGLLDRADWTWSLSRLTFPHELVRGLVAEQLYRAVTISRGLPYHK